MLLSAVDDWAAAVGVVDLEFWAGTAAGVPPHTFLSTHCIKRLNFPTFFPFAGYSGGS